MVNLILILLIGLRNIHIVTLKLMMMILLIAKSYSNVKLACYRLCQQLDYMCHHLDIQRIGLSNRPIRISGYYFLVPRMCTTADSNRSWVAKTLALYQHFLELMRCFYE